MASETITFEADGYLQGKIEWSSTSNGSSANNSTVRATLYARRTNNYTTSGKSWSGYVGIGGDIERINFSSSVSVGPDWVEMVSFQRTVNHNSDGTKQVTIEGSVTGPSGTALANNTSEGAQDVWLDRIPRYTSISSFTVSKRDETSFTFNWRTADTIDYVWYSTNNGSSWTGYDVTDGTSGSFVVSGLSANTSYNCKLRVRRKDSQLNTDSSAVSQTTYNYPYITAVETANLIIGNQQKITLYNPLSRNVTIRMYKDSTSGTQLYSGTTTGTSISFTPTASTLYASIPNATSAKCVYSAIYSSSTKTTTGSYTYKIKGTEIPTFSNFTYQDTNGTTTALTGNNQILVKGYSNVKATISTANKATANNSATMKSYKMVVGSKSDTQNYSSSAEVNLNASNVDSGTITVYATDSRGLSKSVAKTATFKQYTDLVIKSVTATRGNNGVGQAVTLSFNGTYWNDSFGSVTNSIREISYQYKETTASSWTTGATALSVSTSGSNWSGSASIKGDLGANGFDVSKSYNIRLQVSDQLLTKTYDLVLTSGTPAMSIYKNNIAIGKKYDTSQGGVLQIGGKVGGDIYFNNNSSSIIWKENGYGDKFRIIPEFGGTDDSNKLRIQGTVGGAGEDPTNFSDLMTISAKNGLVQHKDNVTIAKSSGDVGFYAKRTDTDVEVWFGVGSGGANHGVFSRKFSKWLINYDASGYVYVNGIQDNHSVANTTNTWIPVYNGNSIEHCLRSLWNSKQHTNYNNNQDNLVTLSVLSYWNGAYNDNGNSNLTYAHEGTIQCKPVNLYNNTSGATGTITLSQSAANFSFLRIYAMTSSENYRVSVDVYSPNGQSAYLIGGWQSGTNINFKATAIKISGTSITRVSNGFFAIGNGGEASVSSPSDVVAILRVDGYK